MANNRVIFGEGPDGDFAIGENATFDVQLQPKIMDNNEVSAVEVVITVEGDLVAANPQAVAAALAEMTGELIDRKIPLRIRIEVDGVVLPEHDWQPSQELVGPFVTLVETVPSPGNAAGHWRYRIQASTREPGTQGELVSDVQTSLSVLTVNGVVTRKVWRATAKGKSITQAVNKVMSFKPSESNVSEELEKFYKEQRASAIWTWEPRQDNKILRYQEVVSYLGGAHPLVMDPQAGLNTPPLVFKGRMTEMRIIVRGTIFGFSDVLQAPEAHFSPSGDLFRDVDAEEEHDTQVDDVLKGSYKLEYEERWVSVGATIPAINHHGHNKIQLQSPPADGAMAS